MPKDQRMPPVLGDEAEERRPEQEDDEGDLRQRRDVDRGRAVGALRRRRDRQREDGARPRAHQGEAEERRRTARARRRRGGPRPSSRRGARAPPGSASGGRRSRRRRSASPPGRRRSRRRRGRRGRGRRRRSRACRWPTSPCWRPPCSIAESVTATRTRMPAEGRAKRGTASLPSLARRGAGWKRPRKSATPASDTGTMSARWACGADPGLADGAAGQARGEEADAPEGMRPVHDPPADEGLGAVRLDVEDDLDRADHQPDRHEQEEERQRVGRMHRHGEGGRHQRNGGEERAAEADALEDRRGEGERDERADRGSDQPEPQRPLAHVHGVLDVGQPGKDVAEAEGIDGEAGIDPALRRQRQPDAHLDPSRPARGLARGIVEPRAGVHGRRRVAGACAVPRRKLRVPARKPQ